MVKTIRSHRAAVWLAIGLTSIALAIVLEKGFLDSSQRAEPGGEATPGVPMAPPHPIPRTTNSFVADHPIASSGNSRSKLERRSDMPSPMATPAKPSLAYPGGAPMQGGSESPTPKSVAREEPDDSVIGRPFPVSASVEARCRNWANKADDPCEDVHKLLSRMAQEPRDTAWAAQMEEEIRDQVMTGSPGKYSIRAVECRTSVCAVEVASLFGLYFGPKYDDPLSSKLEQGIHTWGYEFDASGGRITVTVMPFTRR